MSKNQFVLQIPYGTRDFLPGEAACKREIEDSLAEVFDQWGYDEVVTPTIELCRRRKRRTCAGPVHG